MITIPSYATLVFLFIIIYLLCIIEYLRLACRYQIIYLLGVHYWVVASCLQISDYICTHTVCRIVDMEAVKLNIISLIYYMFIWKLYTTPTSGTPA